MKQTLKELVVRGTRIALSLDGVGGRPLYTVEVNGSVLYASLDRDHAATAFGIQCEQAGDACAEGPRT